MKAAVDQAIIQDLDVAEWVELLRLLEQCGRCAVTQYLVSKHGRGKLLVSIELVMPARTAATLRREWSGST